MLALTGTGTQGVVVSKTPASCKVAFANIANASYCIETAVEEGKHVQFLYGALGALAVAQPQIDLMGSFNTLYAAASGTSGATFDPFTTDFPFLAGAYIFEDVGVTAYHGAASLFTTTTTGKTYLQAAAGILAVEAYHAGLVRHRHQRTGYDRHLHRHHQRRLHPARYPGCGGSSFARQHLRPTAR